MIEEETTLLKTQCVALLFECPVNRNSSDCPFAKVRGDNDVVRRVNWLKSQGMTELKSLLKHHHRCRCDRAEGAMRRECKGLT